MAAAPGSDGQELDWEQRWEPAAAGSRRIFSVSAALPAGLRHQAVGWVAAVCDGCATEGSEPSPTPLGAVQLQSPAVEEGQAGGDIGSAAVVFLLRASTSAPAAAAKDAAPTTTGTDGGTSGAAAPAAGSQAGRAAGRRMLQAGAAPAPLADCSLAVGSAPAETFAGCKSVATSPAASYQVYCTLEPSAGGTRWRGGVKVAASAVGGQWAG